MNVVDLYLELLATTAQCFVEQGRTARDIMGRAMRTSVVPELVNLRVQFLAQQDRDRVGPFLGTGCFSDMAGDSRLASFLVCLELDDEISKLDVCRRFRKYDPEQPLFARCNELWSAVREAELVAATHARPLGRSGLVEVAGGWARLDAFLPPGLWWWAKSTFMEASMFVRLDPWFMATEKPLEPLWEAAVRPARPDWWKTLALRPRERDGAHYVLQEPHSATPATVNEYWEYHVIGVRSLEVHAKRNTAGNLSMMIEELADDRRPDGRVIGRCMHLDTDSAAGTNAEAAHLNHIDVAINLYFGQAAERRKAMRLSDGIVEDASVRTHLLRVEGVPFASSAEFARQFFQSTALLDEWMRDQFAGPIEPIAVQ